MPSNFDIFQGDDGPTQNTQKMANGQPYTGPTENGIEEAPEAKAINALASGYGLVSGVRALASGAGTLAGMFSSVEDVGKAAPEVYGTTSAWKPNDAGITGPLAKSDSELVFKGMNGAPGEDAEPLFDVNKPGHPYDGSTISGKSAIELGLKPSFEDVGDMVKNMQDAGRTDEQIATAIDNYTSIDASLRPDLNSARTAITKAGLNEYAARIRE